MMLVVAAGGGCRWRRLILAPSGLISLVRADDSPPLSDDGTGGRWNTRRLLQKPRATRGQMKTQRLVVVMNPRRAGCGEPPTWP